MGSLGDNDAGCLSGTNVTVTVISKDMVVPASPTTDAGDLFLASFDIMWHPMHYNQRVLFYKTSVNQVSQAVETLKQSLSQVLVHYFPWSGRIALKPVQQQQQQQKHQNQDGDSDAGKVIKKRHVIECNDAGVEFVEACVDLPISQLEKHGFQMMPFYEHLCQRIIPHGDALYSVPLLSIQATRFCDGGLALGVSQSHVVADGQALWNFMVSWSETARGVGISMQPVHDRKLLGLLPEGPSEEIAKGFSLDDMKVTIADEVDQEDGGDHINNNINNEGVQENGQSAHVVQEANRSSNGDDKTMDKMTPTSNGGNEAEPAKPKKGPRMGESVSNLVQFLFNISGETIKKLKEESGGKYTTFEVICSHFWQKITAARLDTEPNPILPPSKTPALFLVLVNIRSRTVPPLPASYFGNAIMFGMGVGSAAAVRQEPLASTAQRLREAVTKGSNPNSSLSFLHYMELNNNSMPPPEFTPGTQIVNVASSPRFPAYLVDFGWGVPAAVRSAKVPGNGEMVLFGGNPNSSPGNVEICIALPDDVLKRLLHDPTFLATYQPSPSTF